MPLSVEDVDLIEQALCAVINKMEEMLEPEVVSTGVKMYENDYANFFEETQSEISQAWVHMGRLKKRMING